jgi:threonylcarbamoyladenosine tRNA methylthiotransferase MtaB
MKVYLDTIGCRLNQSEIETFARQFRSAGHTIVSSPGEADMVVINTCAVTTQAASDSRQKIRQAARAAALAGGQSELIVTGCWSTLDPGGAQSLMGVTRVVPNLEKDQLVAGVLDLPLETFDLEPVAREPLPGAHLRTRAFIKVQDGCDNHCTFCVTRIARGPGRSREIEQVLRDIHSALEGGAQELVLTGVHLGSWGQDFQTPAHLYDLVEGILREPALPRLRLSSLEPWDLDEAFFSLWSDPRLCRHLHLPLQSGSTETLRRMARKTTPESFAHLVDAARKASPDIAITTDLIVGFPGETDEQFMESLEFVRQVEFANGHVFTYSARPGTAAARMPNQVPQEVRKQRSMQMRAVFAASAEQYRLRFIDEELDVLWEATDSFGPDGWHLHGLTDNYLPVTVNSPQRLWNQLSKVKLVGLTAEGMRGEIAG